MGPPKGGSDPVFVAEQHRESHYQINPGLRGVDLEDPAEPHRYARCRIDPGLPEVAVVEEADPLIVSDATCSAESVAVEEDVGAAMRNVVWVAIAIASAVLTRCTIIPIVGLYNHAPTQIPIFVEDNG